MEAGFRSNFADSISLGEAALKDQVNRHYFSMFAAVGAVGVLSGLTAVGGNPYEGGTAGMRSGAGQGLGQAATHLGPFLESLTHHHYSRRTPAARLVHIRRAGASAHKRRMKNETNLDRSSCYPTLYHRHHTPAHAVFGSILAGIQRAMMISIKSLRFTKTPWRRSLLTEREPG